jgi:hypothetical protein
MKHNIAQISLALGIAALCVAPLYAADQAPAPSAAPASGTPENRVGAGNRGNDATAAQGADAAKENRYAGKITAVDKEAKTVSVDDKNLGPHKLHIGESTKIQKEGAEAGTWNDLKVGAQVEGTCKKHGEMFHAETVKVTETK